MKYGLNIVLHKHDRDGASTRVLGKCSTTIAAVGGLSNRLSNRLSEWAGSAYSSSANLTFLYQIEPSSLHSMTRPQYLPAVAGESIGFSSSILSSKRMGIINFV